MIQANELPLATSATGQPQQQIDREQIPKDTLLDIFSCNQRTDLDKCSNLSRQFRTLSGRVHPVRPVSYVRLYFDADKNLYQAVFERRRHDQEKNKEITDELRYISRDVSGITELFFYALRFCSIDSLTIQNFPITQQFLNGMEVAKKDFQCKNIGLVLFGTDLDLSVNPFAFLRLFPDLEQLRSSANCLLNRYYGHSDNLLKQLTSHRFWDAGSLVGSGFTDEALLDYALGAHPGGQTKRCVDVIFATNLSSEFVSKLVQACRDCSSDHDLSLKIHATGVFDISELDVNGMRVVAVNDLPSFEMSYEVDDMVSTIRCWRNCQLPR